MTDEEKKRFISMEKDIHEIKVGMKDISMALLGSPLTKDGGLVKRIIELEGIVEQLEGKINEQEKKTSKLEQYQKIMWTSIGGVGMAIISFVLQFIFKK
jgi:hypothetical protein